MKRKPTLRNRQPCEHHDKMVIEKQRVSQDIQLLSKYGLPSPIALKKLASLSSHIIECEEKCQGQCKGE